MRRNPLHPQLRQSRMRAEYSAAAGGVILVARFAASALLNYAFGIALAWLLVPAQFGTVSAVQNVLLLSAGMLTAGPPWALAMRIAQTHGDPEAAKPEFRTALIANIGFGLVLGAAFLVVQLSGHQLVPTHLVRLDIIVAAEMPLLALNNVLWAVAQGSRRFGGLGIMQSGEILIKCAVGLFLVTVLHAGPGGIALSFLVGTAGSVLIGLRTAKGLVPGPGRLANLGFLAASGSVWLASASMTFLITADLLGLEMVGRAAGVTSAVLAGYQACGLLARASYYVSDALSDSVFPYIAHSQSLREKHRWFSMAARWVPLVIVPIQAELILAPGPVLRLFLPDHYSGAQLVLRVLAAGTLGALTADMLIKSLFAAGHRREIGRLMPIAAAVEAAGLVILVPRHGALGAACSYLIAVCVSVALLVPVHLRAFQVRLPSARQVSAYLLGLAPTAVMFTVAGRAPAPLAWVLIVAGMGLFLIPARRMRLITDADMRFLRDLRARLTGPRPAQHAPEAGWPDSPDSVEYVTPRRESWWASLLGEWPLAAFCVGVAAFTMLYNLFASPDLVYDEAVYSWAAQQVALGWHLTLDNQPLFVHPPLSFLMQAAWLHLTGEASAAMPTVIRTARLLAASVGVANMLLITSLVYLLASSASVRQRRLVTGITAVLAALDPVLLRYDRQNVIEPFALCMSMVTLHAAWRMRNRGTLAYVSVTGVLGGLTLLTNEIAVFLVVVPLIFALVERNKSHICRCAAAFGVAIAFALLFPLWAVELGLGGSFLGYQNSLLQRGVGVEQVSGFNVPGVSLLGSLRYTAPQYAGSYIVLAIGFAALIWCWSRRNTQSGNFLTAWLTASYCLGVYIATVGTSNEQFYVYVIPASVAGSVLLGDALIAGWLRRRARAAGSRRSAAGVYRLPLAIGLTGCAGLIGLSAVSWVVNYTGPGDAVLRLTQYIEARLPACTAINVSGDADRFQKLTSGRSLTTARSFEYFTVGAAALADGVHYFMLSPSDAIEQNGNMTPALADWIRANGQRLVTFPSATYKTLQLWYVPVDPYDPVADVEDIAGGVYVNTTGTDCGGYTVTDGPGGNFYAAYQALGGKAMVGDPLSRVAGTGPGGPEQLFDGVVLAGSRTAGSRTAGSRTAGSRTAGSAVRALPVVAMLAKDAPAAYRRAGLPPVYPRADAARRRQWLTNPAIARAYLDGAKNGPASYAAAVQRYGKPLGPPAVLPGGEIGQAFADAVLAVPRKGGTVHAVAVTPAALAAGVLRMPASARHLQPRPPLPNPNPLGPAQPTTVEPFVLTLGAALLAYGCVVAALARRQRRRRRAEVVGYQQEEVAV